MCIIRSLPETLHDLSRGNVKYRERERPVPGVSRNKPNDPSSLRGVLLVITVMARYG